MKKLKNEELNRLSVDGFKKADKLPVILVLDNLRSLNNIGSIFRTADAFRIEKIYLCGFTAKPPHREIQKTALGATESVDWEYFSSTAEAVDSLQQLNYLVFSLEQTDKGNSLQDVVFSITGKYAFVFGNEVKGVSTEIVEMSDKCIEIPQFGTKHSFNVSISAGIVLWHYFMQVHK